MDNLFICLKVDPIQVRPNSLDLLIWPHFDPIYFISKWTESQRAETNAPNLSGSNSELQWGLIHN